MLLRSLLLASALALTAAAQIPPAAPPRAIPPRGITLTDLDRRELAAGTAALRVEIDALARDLAAEARLAALLPDVEIFHKAVAWALADDTFYSPKEIAAARHLLEEGHARAAQLRTKQAPWLDAKGLIVRGYRSKLDGSVQPYGLVVPENATRRATGTPLLVWLLGRGEKRTELAFLAEREAGPPPVQPAGVITLVPYGRFCNATKFAGEVDVLEALAAVRAHYPVDGTRIALAGFSMGGGSTWHLATHHSTLWCVASPGAGFAETPIFTKAAASNKEPRPAWEQLLWRQYESTGIAGNLFNLPTIAYAGEIDPQKEASDLMAAAMANEGLTLERLIGPQTAHKYHDATKAALTARLDALIAQGRDPSPREVRLQTYTLRYPEAAWVRILGLEKHWERAEVNAVRSEDGKVITLKTHNVSALWLEPLRDGNRFSGTIDIDGQVLPARVLSDQPLALARSPDWKLVDLGELSAAPHKSPGLTGPIDDAFFEPFLFVRPTGKPLTAELGTWAEGELTAAVHLWREVFRGDVPVRSDREVTEADIRDHNLILWGDPSSNRLLARIIARLPLSWDAKTLTLRGHTYDAARHVPILVFPNPLNPSRYVVLNSGIDFRADGYGNNALQTPKLPDWAVVDLRTAPGPRWPGKIVAAGFFDENWK